MSASSDPSSAGPRVSSSSDGRPPAQAVAPFNRLGDGGSPPRADKGRCLTVRDGRRGGDGGDAGGREEIEDGDGRCGSDDLGEQLAGVVEATRSRIDPDPMLPPVDAVLQQSNPRRGNAGGLEDACGTQDRCSGDSLRQVLDWRRSNMHFCEPPRTALHSAASAGDAEVDEGAELFFSQVDVENAFYQHGIPGWLSE